ncbi:hypothetical protein LTR67_010219 [Exophiala xenobiotica]
MADVPLLLKQPGANIPPIKKYSDKFEGHVVLVTGAAQGIGKVTATMFAQQGASMVLVDLNEAKLKETSAALSATGAKVIHRVCNLTIEKDVRAMVDDVVSTLGKIDVCAHLAGAYPFKLIADNTAEDYARVMSVNMDSTFYLCKAVLPYMSKAGYGRIINTTSASTLHPEAGLGVYAASKAAVTGFTRTLAIEAGPGVTANCVCPSLIYNETTWADPSAREMFQRSVERQPIKRFGLPIDVAEVFCFVASPETEYLTGQLFDVSGGFTHGA